MNCWKKPLFIDPLEVKERHFIISMDCDSVVDVVLYNTSYTPTKQMYNYNTIKHELTILINSETYAIINNTIEDWYLSGKDEPDKLFFEISYYSIQKDREFKLNKILK